MSLNDAGLLLLLHAADGHTRASIAVGRLPDGLAFSGDGQTLYVALSGEQRIAVVRLRDARVTRTITVGDGPSGLLLVPAPRRH